MDQGAKTKIFINLQQQKLIAMDKIDVSKCYQQIEKAKLSRKCSKCQTVSDVNPVFHLIPGCGHTLCQNCYDPSNWKGQCYVPNCKQICDRKDIREENERAGFLLELGNLKSILDSIQHAPDQVTPDNDNEGAKITFNDSDTDIDLDNVDVFKKAPAPLKEISNKIQIVKKGKADDSTINNASTSKKSTSTRKKAATRKSTADLEESPSLTAPTRSRKKRTTIPSYFLEHEDVVPPSESREEMPAKKRKSTTKTSSFLATVNEDIVKSSMNETEVDKPKAGQNSKAGPKKSRSQRTTIPSSLLPKVNEDFVPLCASTEKIAAKKSTTITSSFLTKDNEAIVNVTQVDKPTAGKNSKVAAKKSRNARTTLSSSLLTNEDLLPPATAKDKPAAAAKTSSKMSFTSDENEDIVLSSFPLPEEILSIVSTSKKATATKSKLNKRNKKGETPLHEACVKRNLERVESLLGQGAEPNTQDNNSWTPLHEVAPYPDSILIVKALLENGANPNVPGGDFNSTALHEAAAAGCADICRLLIQKGASKTARDSQGRMPYDVASTIETRKVIDETMCDMSDTEQLETTVLLNASTVPECFVLFAHQLKPEQMDLLKSSLKKLDSYTISTKSITNDVTHLLVNLNEDTASCQPDFQYFHSVLTGKWIVDFKWFEASVKTGSFHSETDFVANGCHDCRTGAPSLSKSNASNRLPRLFDGCHFYLTGLFQAPYPSKSDLINLLKDGGATILRREPDPEFIPVEEQKMPYHSKMGSSLAKCSHFIIYQEGLKEPLLKYNMDHIKTLPTAWLFECIKNFAIVEPFN